MVANDLDGLIRYLDKDDWGACFADVLADHVGPALETADLTFQELCGILGHDQAMTLWGCAFEDFLGQDWDEGRNFVEVYLKRRGWKEGPRNSAYMRALKDSVMSLYEVSDIVLGQSFMARDLLRGGKAVLVSERTATQTLRPWDRIAARLVPLEGRTVLAGGLLHFTPRACADLADNLREVLRRKPAKAEFPKVRTEVLEDIAPMFTLTWLFRAMEDMARRADVPVLFNGDGEELVFQAVCFPLAKGVVQKTVAEVLDGASVLEPERRLFWNWLRAPDERVVCGAVGDDRAQFLTTEMDDGRTVLGTLELRGRQLRLEVNSEARAERGRALVVEALGDLVGQPLTQIMTMEQAMAAQSGADEALDFQLPPEEEVRVIAEMLARHYRKALDDVVPALGNVTPWQAVATAAGRKRVAAWLKQAENTTKGLGASGFVFGWMWDELEIADLRG